MKRKKIALYSVFMIGLILSFTACKKKDVDTTAPTVTINTPTDGQAFLIGKEITVDVKITDDIALASYEIDIHLGGDHNHKIAAETEWTYEESETIDGTEHMIQKSIAIPADAEHGTYHFLVSAIDAAGNKSDLAVREIELDH